MSSSLMEMAWFIEDAGEEQSRSAASVVSQREIR